MGPQRGGVKVAVALQAGPDVLGRPLLTSCFRSTEIGRVIKGDKLSLLPPQRGAVSMHIGLQWQQLLVPDAGTLGHMGFCPGIGRKGHYQRIKGKSFLRKREIKTP